MVDSRQIFRNPFNLHMLIWPNLLRVGIYKLQIGIFQSWFGNSDIEFNFKPRWPFGLMNLRFRIIACRLALFLNKRVTQISTRVLCNHFLERLEPRSCSYSPNYFCNAVNGMKWGKFLLSTVLVGVRYCTSSNGTTIQVVQLNFSRLMFLYIAPQVGHQEL